ncbi:hypothetical protein [Faecalicatena contorta]|uniref:hypothetical protein n=1 Tax=Faecalicatena contorta TaxID=39482 RepID=UPI001F44680F|nr:hypothetical protein [Faecalicatena contorta]MCF2667976.1 hypothetical protein [Faecalicatena contorta]
MIKKKWEKPNVIVQQFTPNEYVAACGDENKVYKFECDKSSKYLNTGGIVYLETNGEPGLQRIGANPDHRLGNYYPCGKTHEAPVKDTFKEGYFIPTLLAATSYNEDVIVWQGDDGHNIHCTGELDMSTWETTKS